VTLVVHQLKLYQSTAKALQKLPKSEAVDVELRTYISLASYLAAIISAFSQELAADVTSSSNAMWRSIHLDYHLALALHGSAFTQEQQEIALKTMRRSWAHFTEKRRYKKLQDRE